MLVASTRAAEFRLTHVTLFNRFFALPIGHVIKLKLGRASTATTAEISSIPFHPAKPLLSHPGNSSTTTSAIHFFFLRPQTNNLTPTATTTPPNPSTLPAQNTQPTTTTPPPNQPKYPHLHTHTHTHLH
ncbi:hypothetical protein P167DRAFT_396959 [Morchella conica CCBAS932]|uniref:Uncharacterized protein n=1 Tax=Morchella conica CCBAS932 TaxID=1392247 RepID=A0A3N4KE03_9PEZI|nr:hypothetical protein P167DRAFT_396959 [Morchella conica CCBAS932]